MIGETTNQAIETCEIVWWSGYVRGRFQAIAVSPSARRRVIDESAQIRWRSTSPPAPIRTAVEALEALTSRLAEAGWSVGSRSEERWFGLVLSRPVAAGAETPVTSDADDELDEAPRLGNEPQLSALLAELHSARREAELERRRRIDAESRARQLLASPSPPKTEVPDPPQRPLLLAAYAIAVAGAAMIFLIGLHSVYAAIVAALTTAALSLAVDSWRVAHQRTASARQAGRTGTTARA
jgi:hypothetical protein